MKDTTKAALIAYLEALKEEGFTHVHVSDVIPMTLRTTDRRTNLAWTQFPTLDVPESMIYNKFSGFFYLDTEWYKKAIGSQDAR